MDLNPCTTFFQLQAHAEATGHSNFEESNETLITYRCKECGKLCRSQTERDLHEKRVGHGAFQEVQNVNGVDTEEEMKSLRKENGIDGSEDKDMVEPTVDQKVLSQLESMGFSKNKSIRALHFSGNQGIDAAIEWISSQRSDDAELEMPLLVPSTELKPSLSPEEAKARAQELVMKAKQRREAEEREAERARELIRVKEGKNLAAIARREEEQRLKRMAEEREREKREAAAAREKIRKKLGTMLASSHTNTKSSIYYDNKITSYAEQDRMERRAALGLPPELTEEEKEEERRRLEERAEKEAKPRLPVKPREKIDKMRNLLVTMKKENSSGDEGGLNTAFQTLSKLISNVVNHPDNPKFRKVNLSNPKIIERIGKYNKAIEFLGICGFSKSEESGFMELLEEDMNQIVLRSASECLENALTNPFFGVL